MNSETQSSYDLVAQHYAEQFRDEMDTKPFDRKMLDWLIEKTEGLGIICDMGCGPGQIARYLHGCGATVCGVDLSPEMVRHAQALNLEIAFEQGDILALNGIADHSFGGIAAFHSIIHIPRDRVVEALREFRRVLRPGGVLLLVFHIGQETKHLDEWWGNAVNVDFHFFETQTIKAHLVAAGFTLEEAIERDPYPETIEFQSRRAYLFARNLSEN